MQSASRRRTVLYAAALGLGAISLCGQPGSVDLEDQAAKLAAAGKYREAASLYETLVKREPHSAPAFINLGVAYAKLGQLSLASAAYRSALKIDPKSLPALINLGLAEFKGGNFGKAVVPLKTALRLEPGNRQAMTLLAMCHFTLREFTLASRLFESLYEADQRNTMLQYLLGESYFRSHQQDRLDAFVQRLTQSSPDSAALHMLAGEAYDRLNRTDEAIREFKIAKAAAPFLPRIHFYLGYLYWEKKQYEEAAGEFDAERASPTGERALAEGYLGDIALKNGDFKRAEALLKSALKRDPKIHIARLDLGIIYAEQNRFPDAERELEAAIALAPHRVDAQYRLAQVYRAQGKHELQKSMLSKVRQINEAKRRSVASVLLNSPADLR